MNSAEGINSVAALVSDGSGRISGAIHVHGPAFRFPPEGRSGDVGDAAWIHRTDRLLARLASHGKDFSRLARLTQSESRNNPESQYRRSPPGDSLP